MDEDKAVKYGAVVGCGTVLLMASLWAAFWGTVLYLAYLLVMHLVGGN